MRIVVTLSLIFFARFLAGALAEPMNDADLTWQNWLGKFILNHHYLPRQLGPETYTAAGAAWVPQEWALSVAVAAVHSVHLFWLLAILASLCATITLIIAARIAILRGADRTGALFTSICCGFAMFGSFGVRAQIFGWLCFAILLYLDTRGERFRRWAPLVILLWANLHASAPFGVAYLLLRLAFDRTRVNALTVALSAAALFVTPLGASLPIYAVELVNAPFRHWIAEWQPTTIAFLPVAVGIVAPLLVLVARGLPNRRFDIVLVCGTVVFAFLAIRNVPLASLILAPIAGAQMTRAGWTLRPLEGSAPNRIAIAVSFALAALSGAMVWAHLRTVPDFTVATLPFKAMQVAAASGESRIYCEDFAWCALALERPELRVFIDGRCDPYPANVWNDYISIKNLDPKWKSALARTRTELVLARTKGPLAQGLHERGDWRAIYADKSFVLFEHGTAGAITKRERSHARGYDPRVLATDGHPRTFLARAQFQPNAPARARNALP